MKSFKFSKLSDIATIEWGNTSITKKKYIAKGVPAFSAAGQDGYLPTAEWHGYGIILSAIGAKCGKCFFADGKWTAIKNTIVIKPNDKLVDAKFLFHYLNEAKRWAISGSGQPFITLKTAKEVEIPLFRLNIQNKIAYKIDSLFADIDAGLEKINEVKAKLDSIKQSILKQAFDGTLIGAMKSFKFSKLSDIASISYGKGLLTKDLKKSGFPVFGANGTIGYFDKYLYERPKLLISCRGAYSGTPNMSPKKCFITNNSLIINFSNESYETRKFYYYFFQTLNKDEYVTGTAQPQVTINKLKDIIVPLAELMTQKKIVSKIDSLFVDIDNQFKKINQLEQQLNSLKQSILKQAFEGNLV